MTLIADLAEFVHHHRPHGSLTADATEPAWNGYLLTVTCPCGVVFERAYSNSTWTQPSTASFMTSEHRRDEAADPVAIPWASSAHDTSSAPVRRARGRRDAAAPPPHDAAARRRSRRRPSHPSAPQTPPREPSTCNAALLSPRIRVGLE
jgi:hypothetical protein